MVGAGRLQLVWSRGVLIGAATSWDFNGAACTCNERRVVTNVLNSFADDDLSAKDPITQPDMTNESEGCSAPGVRYRYAVRSAITTPIWNTVQGECCGWFRFVFLTDSGYLTLRGTFLALIASICY